MIDKIQNTFNDWIPEGHPLRKLPYGKLAFTAGGGALGGDTILRNRVSIRHENLGRQLERDKALTEGFA